MIHFKKNISAVLASMLMASSAFCFTSSAEKTPIWAGHVYGSNRLETSIKASDYVQNTKMLVVASGRNYSDSLSAYNIASKYNARLLLVGKNSNIKDEMRKHNLKKVFIVGGENIVGKRPIDTLKEGQREYHRNTQYKVLAGKNRYETNEITLREGGFNKVGVADGRNFPDALASFGLLRKHNLGLMLVKGNKPYTTNRTVVYTFGGPSSVITDGGKRIYGKNRYETCDVINREVKDVSVTAITSGKHFADALSSINLVIGYKNASLLLVDSPKISLDKKKLVRNAKVNYVVGGTIDKDIQNRINRRFAGEIPGDKIPDKKDEKAVKKSSKVLYKENDENRNPSDKYLNAESEINISEEVIQNK